MYTEVPWRDRKSIQGLRQQNMRDGEDLCGVCATEVLSSLLAVFFSFSFQTIMTVWKLLQTFLVDHPADFQLRQYGVPRIQELRGWFSDSEFIDKAGEPA